MSSQIFWRCWEPNNSGPHWLSFYVQKHHYIFTNVLLLRRRNILVINGQHEDEYRIMTLKKCCARVIIPLYHKMAAPLNIAVKLFSTLFMWFWKSIVLQYKDCMLALCLFICIHRKPRSSTVFAKCAIYNLRKCIPQCKGLSLTVHLQCNKLRFLTKCS